MRNYRLCWRENVVPILIEGLHKLEYRGYDSAGVAVLDGDCIRIRKYKGRLSVLAAGAAF